MGKPKASSQKNGEKSSSLQTILGMMGGLIVICLGLAVIVYFQLPDTWGPDRGAILWGILSGPTRTPRPTATPNVDIPALFEQARELVETDGEKVRPLLLPLLEWIEDPEQRITAYDLIGDGESSAGNYQIAAAYYEMSWAMEQTTDRAWKIAYAYDWGGNQEKAIAWYEILLNRYDPITRRSEIEQRIQHLKSVLPQPTATP